MAQMQHRLSPGWPIIEQPHSVHVSRIIPSGISRRIAEPIVAAEPPPASTATTPGLSLRVECSIVALFSAAVAGLTGVAFQVAFVGDAAPVRHVSAVRIPFAVAHHPPEAGVYVERLVELVPSYPKPVPPEFQAEAERRTFAPDTTPNPAWERTAHNACRWIRSLHGRGRSTLSLDQSMQPKVLCVTYSRSSTRSHADTHPSHTAVMFLSPP